MSFSSRSTSGAFLRARRQELGLTLDEVADRTRIRRTYLEALEDDRPEALPGETYRTGFLRIYANLLGLKAEDLPEGGGVPLQQAPPPESAPKVASRPSKDKPPVRSVRVNATRTPGAVRRSKRSGKGVYAVAAAALLVLGAVLSASLFQTPDPPPFSPPPVEAPPSPPPVAPAPAPAEVPPADAVVDGAPGETVDPGAATATTDSSLSSAPAESATAPPSGAAPAAPTGTDAQQPAPPAPAKPQPSPEASPAAADIVAAPAKAGVLRLEALGANRIEVILDNRPPQSYDLKADTQLSWKVRRSALVRVEDPSTVKLWFGDRPLALNGTQVLVQTAQEQKTP